MNLGSHLVQRMLRLDPPLTRDLVIERDLRVPMPDGVVLLANRWAPKAGGDGLPVALLRSPYGRGTMIATGMVRPLAERGFQVVIQSVRGTFGSGGVFEPMRNERADGRATIEWIKQQPWFGGSIVLTGASYLGARGHTCRWTARRSGRCSTSGWPTRAVRSRRRARRSAST